MRRWRNWQTRQSQTLVYAGSTPALRTKLFLADVVELADTHARGACESVKTLCGFNSRHRHPTSESGGNRQTHEAQTFAGSVKSRESSNLSSRIADTHEVNGEVGKLV